MSLPRPLIVCICLIALSVVGCSKGGNSSGGSSQIRVVNAFFEAPALTVVAAGTTLAPALPFQGLTPYASVSNGTQTFTVTVAGASTPLVNQTTSTTGGANYTYVIFGP